MDSAYFGEYYRLEREHWWFRVRARIIIQSLEKVVEPGEKLRILNIGAATGRSTELLAAFGEVVSVEYDADCCRMTNEQTGLDIIQASMLDLPFEDNRFDLVCAFDVIEHVEEEDKAVEEMKRVCKTGGLLYITVPAFMSLWSHHDVVNQHFRRYTMSQVIQLFDPKQLSIVRRTYFNFFLFFPIFLFRSLSKVLPNSWVRKKAGSDFTVIGEKSLINQVLFHIFKLEWYLLRVTNFPIGVSILFMMKKS